MAIALRKETTSPDTSAQTDFEEALTRRVTGYVSASDYGEDARRRHDRTGAKLFYGQHWDRPMPSDRAAIVANLAMSLLLHKVAIMTKQDPIPVVEPDDVGDAQSAELMRSIVQKVWSSTDMRLKLRRGVVLSNATRTCALKVLWDPVLRGGAGDINTDVIPGWRLIIDDRVSDSALMEYCGNRVTMGRSRAMLFYPDAADKIANANDLTQSQRGGPTKNRSGSPIPSPWKSGTIPNPGGGLVNGKPVVTAFAGEVPQVDTGTKDVEIVELYHRDHTLVRRTVPARDPQGRKKQNIVRDENGIPKITLDQDEMHYVEGVGHIALPTPKLVMEDVMEDQLVRKYPFWRRTTILLPDNTLLEDMAWDGPLPYAFITDVEPLDGMWGRGSFLQNEHLQALLNISLSTITDNLRFGSLNAWFAGEQSGLTAQQYIIPSVGQVIPVRDASQITPISAPGLDSNWFTLLDKTVNFMERIIGAVGVMQGESVGRVDTGQAYDTLAEIGCARLVECTQRMETSISKWAEIVGWFAQKYYDEKHSIAVQDAEGNVTWERAWGPMLQGTLSYNIATGSTMAWSDSAKQARDMQEYQSGIIDKIEYYQRRNTPNWQAILKRLQTNPPQAVGPAASPPPRTRMTVPKTAQAAPVAA